MLLVHRFDGFFHFLNWNKLRIWEHNFDCIKKGQGSGPPGPPARCALLKGPLDCTSNHAIYLSECKKCQYHFPYVGSTKTRFRYRINNYKSTHRKFRKKYVEKDLAIVIKKSELKQKLFHEDYYSEHQQGIENWSVTLMDQVEDID